jgi:Tfp pilus assembly protein PilE
MTPILQNNPIEDGHRSRRLLVRRAAGMTLIEMVIAMSLAAAVLSTLAVIVTRMMAVQSLANDHLSTLVTVGRLGEQFRDDAHAAASAGRDAAGGDQRISFALADRTIRYTVAEPGIERVVLKDDQPVARDTFMMPLMRVIGFDDAAASGEVTLLVARVAPLATAEAPPARPFPITARLNRGAASRGEP